jgi:GNAT superfamily N-acetyltransferase
MLPGALRAYPRRIVLALAASREGVAERVALRDGSSVVVRALEQGDVGAIESWFLALQPRTRYARFLGSLKRLDSRTLAELARVDHARHEAVAAIAPDGATVGIARYLRLADPAEAEVAVTVVDAWQRRGLATVLLARLADKARAAGVRRFTGTCLASNHAAITLLRRLGPLAIGTPNVGVVDVRVDLCPEGSRRP